jgi:hypothetical protein
MLAGIALTPDGKQHRLALTFTAGAFRDDEVFDSANCPPSRYLIEMGRRLLEIAPTAKRLVIGNPLLPLTPDQVAGWIPPALPVPVVIVDAQHFPLAYCLPRWLVEEEERFLLMLSACDAGLDVRLLGLIASCEAGALAVPKLDIGAFPLSTPTGWFMGPGRQEMLRRCTIAALTTIQRNTAWRSLPIAAYLPYHAGSLLMLNLAARQVPGGFFAKEIICASYRDIVEACPSPLEMVPLRLPWLPRDSSVGELEYLTHALERLGPEVRDTHFFGFLRYSRLYNRTPFHLIDQMKFALGHSMRSPADTIHGGRPLASARADLPAKPLKLLFHLAGGWTLKSYSAAKAASMFLALRGFGCEISVIDRPDLVAYGARLVTSDDSALLTAEVKAHHIFIGVDSFPHHFVRHVLGWPTVALFANTKPCNSDAREGPDYRAVVGALPCNPCGAEQHCPILGGEDCANFAAPHAVVAAILEMARAVYGFKEGA